MSATDKLISLYEKYRSDLGGLIAAKFKKNQHDAEDIVQDAFYNVLRAKNIDAIDNPKAYLYQAASNLALNRIRKNNYHRDYIASMDDTAVDMLTPERNVLAQHDLKMLETAMDKLPKKYQTTFLMSRMHSKSYKEIAADLNIAESTVEKHIIKTLKHLRSHLDEEVGV